ncbi:uncharacterized protein LOC143232513 [Tachypleus tridentatus]|uniref:uncharacterized protein LOC143232513 n=1 Tax=Tachypleus tridentatus TaxID=6853 RepID=UPI003FD6358B
MEACKVDRQSAIIDCWIVMTSKNIGGDSDSKNKLDENVKTNESRTEKSPSMETVTSSACSQESLYAGSLPDDSGNHTVPVSSFAMSQPVVRRTSSLTDLTRYFRYYEHIQQRMKRSGYSYSWEDFISVFGISASDSFFISPLEITTNASTIPNSSWKKRRYFGSSNIKPNFHTRSNPKKSLSSGLACPSRHQDCDSDQDSDLTSITPVESQELLSEAEDILDNWIAKPYPQYDESPLVKPLMKEKRKNDAIDFLPKHKVTELIKYWSKVDCRKVLSCDNIDVKNSNQ